MRFLRKVFELVDNSTRPMSAAFFANRCENYSKTLVDTTNRRCSKGLSTRCNIAGAAVSFAAILAVVFTKTMDAPLAGFILSFSLSFSDKILWTVRNWTEHACVHPAGASACRSHFVFV